MANVKICKKRLPHISRQLLAFQNKTNFTFFTFKKYVKIAEYNFRNDTIRWQMSKSTKHTHTFCACSNYRFRYINFLTFLPSKDRSRSHSTILAIILFNGKCQNTQMSPTQFCTGSYRFRKQVNVTKYNFRNDTIRWKILKSTNVSHTFCASSYRFRDKKFYFKKDFKKVGQDHVLQSSQLRHSMANVKIYKCHFLHF